MDAYSFNRAFRQQITEPLFGAILHHLIVLVDLEVFICWFRDVENFLALKIKRFYIVFVFSVHQLTL